MTRLALWTTALLTFAGGQVAAEAHTTPFMLAEVSGDGISGEVSLTQTPSGIMLVQIDLTGVPEGLHGVHIHETGDCSADDFTSAGGHLAGDAGHGIMSEDGPHPGDLPNAMVGADGILSVTYFNERLTTDLLDDADGAAFILHAEADDYISQPAGAAGDRLACGVFEMPG